MRMESTEKCEVVIQHFNGKYLKTLPGIPADRTDALIQQFVVVEEPTSSQPPPPRMHFTVTVPTTRSTACASLPELAQAVNTSGRLTPSDIKLCTFKDCQLGFLMLGWEEVLARNIRFFSMCWRGEILNKSPNKHMEVRFASLETLLAQLDFVHFIVHFSCFYLSLVSSAPTEPLLCKFADGGQKKRQSQSKYPQNGRAWPRDGEVSVPPPIPSRLFGNLWPKPKRHGVDVRPSCNAEWVFLAPTTRFYSPPYSIATNRMIAQTSITPFIAASPVSTYQVSYVSGAPARTRSVSREDPR
ncbi:hypothetical protein Z043_111222 [Scleropages formosus]|uniref:Uncharacterized protein n=1 Tax=Scleropages formosus TaxID=113540 RepID=A0A0P7VA12_SCLFO|nr:hypothetical protein Z043_111222 [Scleropages formosus]